MWNLLYSYMCIQPLRRMPLHLNDHPQRHVAIMLYTRFAGLRVQWRGIDESWLEGVRGQDRHL